VVWNRPSSGDAGLLRSTTASDREAQNREQHECEDCLHRIQLYARVGGHSGTLAQPSVLRSEGDYGSDGWLYEGVGERLGELMDGSPAGAVRRQ
jgi:hypothetical protein